MTTDPASTVRAADATPVIPKGRRITGSTRGKLAADLEKYYDDGANVRGLAEATGRSYDFGHRVLNEAGVELRSRGENPRCRVTAGWAR